jgi:sugar phosphate isomerase/epimerase
MNRIGIQLYTVRDQFRRDPEGTLAAVRAIGFDEVEFAGYPAGATATQVRAMLARAGLDAPSAHVPLDQVRNRWDAALDFAAGVGHGYLVLAWLPPEERRNLDQYRAVAELLNRRGEAARQRRVTLCYHNHDFEFSAVEGATPYDLLLERTDASLVQLELDLYWVTRGDRDALTYFARWPGRFPMLHVKDMERGPERGFAELGRGRIDFPRIFREAAKAGVRHYFYEQDQTAGSPLESARVSYAYLRSLEVPAREP